VAVALTQKVHAGRDFRRNRHNVVRGIEQKRRRPD
jgi:hypothetical protein